MAVALSSVTSGSKIQLPFIGSQTIEGVVLQYNHYGQSESVVFVGIQNKTVSEITGSHDFRKIEFPLQKANNDCLYEFSPADLFVMQFFSLFADTIKKAAIPVGIWTYRTPTYSGDTMSWSSTTRDMIYRPMFYPAASEIFGYSQSVQFRNPKSTTGYYSYTGSCPTEGGIIPSLLSSIQTMGGGLATSRTWLTTGGPTGISAPSSVTTPLVSGVNAGLSGANYIYTAYYLAFLLTLSGSLMVNSASGGAITESVAVESYRKIGGKWYRTT